VRFPLLTGLRALFGRVAGLIRRRDDERAMRAELQFHLDMETEKHRKQGMPESEARRVARVNFGPRDKWTEAARDELRARLLEDLAFDLRYALRRLRRTGGSSAVVVLLLALGIGANMAIFHVIDALLLQPPPVTAPGELVQFWNADTRATSDFERYTPLSFPEYKWYHDNAQSFAGLAAFDGDPETLSWRTAQGAEPIRVQFISPNFFTVLGVSAAAGQLRLGQDVDPLNPDTRVVLSYAFWRDHLGRDPAIAGRALTLNGRAVTVAGVAAPGFTGLLIGMAPELWISLAMAPAMTHTTGLLESRNSSWLFPTGRLKPGVSAAAGLAEARVLSARFIQGDTTLANIVPALFPTTLVPGPYRSYVAVFTALLQAMMVLVLVIAGANAANLLLAQSAARTHELSLRTTLGASRGRLIRQALAENLMLAIVAGALGSAAGWYVTQLMLGLIPPSIPVRLSISADWRGAAFAMALALGAGAVFGLLSIASARPTARSNAAGARRGGVHGSRLRNALVAAQIAISLALLAGGGLCLRSLARARAVDPGFVADHRYIAQLDLKSGGYTGPASQTLLRALMAGAEQLPGVRAVTIADYLPLETTYNSLVVNRPEQASPSPAGRAGVSAQVFDVGPAFFHTVGTPLQGRDFASTDDERGEKVIVVNDALARRWWPAGNALGRTLRVKHGDTSAETAYRVIGVAATGKYRTLGERPQSVLFRAAFQHDQARATLIVDAAAPAAAALASLRAAIARVDPDIAPLRMGAMEEQLAFALFPARVAGIVLSIVGGLGLVLALTGLAASLAYGVARRTREIGIRIALGARRRNILLQLGRETGRLVGIGLAVGLPLTWALTRVLRSTLAGTADAGTTTILGAVAILVISATAACWIPARRAMRVDPMEAFRHE
jgi:predicted permease